MDFKSDFTKINTEIRSEQLPYLSKYTKYKTCSKHAWEKFPYEAFFQNKPFIVDFIIDTLD